MRLLKKCQSLTMGQIDQRPELDEKAKDRIAKRTALYKTPRKTKPPNRTLVYIGMGVVFISAMIAMAILSKTYTR